MPIEFDGLNKHIKITSPTTSTTALAIYSSAMEWCALQEHIDEDVPMAAVGKFALGGGALSDSIFILINDWKLKAWSGDYQMVCIGTIITDDESPRTVLPDSGNVEWTFQVSSQGIVFDSGGGGTSPWDESMSAHVEAGTFGEQVASKLLTIIRFLGLK